MNALKMKNILMIVGFTLLLIMQPGMGNIFPLAVNLINATGALDGGKATNGTTTSTTAATTTPTINTTTMKPMTTNLTTKKEQQQTTKGTTAAAATTPGKANTPGKVTTAPRKDVEYMAYMNDLFDLENPMKRKHHKRRAHGPQPTNKAAVGGSIVAHPLMYYNMVPPRMQAARIDLELSYKPGQLLGQAMEDGVGGGNGNGAPLKHHKSKVAPTLPPLLEMLSKPQQHPEMPAIMEFLNGIVDLVINSSSSSSKDDNESKPYGYINKTVSPDGKLQRKEFGLRAPNMVIKGVQQETNYGVPAEPNPYEGLEFLGAAPYKPMKMPKKVEPMHHYGLSAEPNLYEGLEFLGPPFKPMKMPKKEHEQPHLKQKRQQQHRREPQLGAQYELLHGGIDKALRKNYEMIDRLLEDLDQEDDLLQKKSYAPKEELLVSCPIHHEFHADRYGDIIEEDVVEVGECEAVKILE